MKPIKFKGQNVTFAEHQKEYTPLPALKFKNDPKGNVVSCWHLSFGERLKVLFTGRVWLNLWSFNQPLSPSRLSVHRKEMFTLPEDTVTRFLNYKFKKQCKG